MGYGYLEVIFDPYILEAFLLPTSIVIFFW